MVYLFFALLFMHTRTQWMACDNTPLVGNFKSFLCSILLCLPWTKIAILQNTHFLKFRLQQSQVWHSSKLGFFAQKFRQPLQCALSLWKNVSVSKTTNKVKKLLDKFLWVKRFTFTCKIGFWWCWHQPPIYNSNSTTISLQQ